MQSPGGRNGFDTQSDVYKMLQDYVEPVSEPKQSGSFKYLQGILEAEDGGRDFCVCGEKKPQQPTSLVSCYFCQEQENYCNQHLEAKTRIEIKPQICLYRIFVILPAVILLYYTDSMS